MTQDINVHHEQTGEPAKPRAGIAPRKRARAMVIQALYQWHMAAHSPTDIEAQFRVDNNFARIDEDFFHEALHFVAQHAKTFDDCLEKHLDRDIKTLDPIELSILRLGQFELVCRADIPYRVVINEAVELAKIYGATDGYKYINGVMDQLSRELRAIEIKP